MLLADGDILKVAETEMTFIASAASQFQRMVTQPIQSRKVAPAPYALPPEVAAIRMMTEATLRQVIPTNCWPPPRYGAARRKPIFRRPLRTRNSNRFRSAAHRGRTLPRVGADAGIGIGDQANRRTALVPRDWFGRYRKRPHRLFSNLKQLQGLLPAGWELGITISLPTDVDILRITEVYRDAREHELRVAFDEFQGNGAQVLHLKSLLPDYLVWQRT